MNCLRCNAPLAPDARFCRICGLPVSTDAAKKVPPTAAPTYRSDAPTVSAPQPAQGTPSPWQAPPQVSSWQVPQQPPPQAAYYQPMAPVEPGTMRSDISQATPNVPARPRRTVGCLVRSLLVLVLLVVVVVGGWFFVARPYLHTLVLGQMDQVLANGVDQVLPVPSFLAPAGTTIPVYELVLNKIIALSLPASSPLQNIDLSIMPSGIAVNLQVYGLSSTVTGVLQTSHGQLVMSDVTVQGIASLVISADDLTTELDMQLVNAQAHLTRTVTKVELQDHQLMLTLG